MDFFKGLVIGFAGIIPGMSGAVFAIIFNVYFKVILAVANFLVDPIKVIKEMYLLVIGFFIGALICLFALSYFLEKYEFYSLMIFTGFVIGGLRFIYLDYKGLKFNFINVFIFIVCFFITLFSNIFIGEGFDKNPGFLTLILLGFLVGMSFIFPGISGSLLLISMGFYNYFINLFKIIINEIIIFEINIFYYIIILGPFLISLIISVVLSSFLMKYLYFNYKKEVNFCLFGVVLATVISVFYKMNFSLISYDIRILGLVFLVTSIYLSDLIFDLSKK